MRKNERICEDDDGRTIADMSGIEPQPMLIPRIRKRRPRGFQRTGRARGE